MRLDGVLLFWGAVGVAVLWATSPAGPWWPPVAALVTATLFLWANWPARVPKQVECRPAVLIPTHNNRGEVGKVVEAALRHGLPVYVVDDGSKDGSGAEAAAAGATVVVHPVNHGKGRALLTGMEALQKAGCTHALCLDADGQHDPADIPSFAAHVAAEPHAIIVGVRDMSTAPKSSRFGRRFSNFWVWVETGWALQDTQCGFRAYPIAPILALGLGGHRYDLEVEVLTRALWAGIPVRDIPCRVYYPPAELRVSSFRPYMDNTRITFMNFRLLAERFLWPLNWWGRAPRQAPR